MNWSIVQAQIQAFYEKLGVPANFVLPSSRLLKNASMGRTRQFRSLLVFRHSRWIFWDFHTHKHVGTNDEPNGEIIIGWSVRKPFRDIQTAFHFYVYWLKLCRLLDQRSCEQIDSTLKRTILILRVKCFLENGHRLSFLVKKSL